MKKAIKNEKGFFKNYKQTKRIGKKDRNYNGLTYSFIEPIDKKLKINMLNGK